MRLLPLLLLFSLTVHGQKAGNTPFIVILGNVQDAGSPHPGCKKDCCRDLFLHPDPERKITALGIVDPVSGKSFLIEATPDIALQMKNLQRHLPSMGREIPDGILVTHAHIGHYTGLMYLGREGLNTKNVPVFVMPRMHDFLAKNGPWSQLVSLGNIDMRPLNEGIAVELSGQLKITPFRVPHRDEYSETIGIRIEGPEKKALFIPDIDKWDRWKIDIIQAIAEVDYAIIDGTFYDAQELGGRDMAEIPHPFMVESMELFRKLPDPERNKIWFIHLNHTNPALNPKSPQSKTIRKNGFHIARINQILEL